MVMRLLRALFGLSLVFHLVAYGECGGEPPDDFVCPDGTVMNDAGHCLLPPEDVIRLDEEPPAGCEDPPPPPTPLTDCAATFEGDPHFETEAQMAEFCESYECVRGGVTIGGTEKLDDIEPNTEITTLAPLACLRTSRFLVVTQTQNLTHIDLPNYEQSDGGFNIIVNQNIEEVSLPALKSIGGDLSVQLNEELTSVSMPVLEQVGEFFLIRGNPELPTSEAWALRDQLCPDAVGASTTIAGNGPN